MKLEPQTVEKIFRDCLFQEGEDTSKHIPAEGITTNVGFHPDRLKQHHLEIVELLQELPSEFQEKHGGGWSFLNACEDKNGNLWTGLHSIMEQLFLLGIAIGQVKCLMPRQMWNALPGGVPYYVVLESASQQS